METIKLIPMTQFVLQLASRELPIIEEISPNDGIGFENFLLFTTRYAKFLSQPLTLSMFVPVSEAEEVLEEPEWSEPLSLEEEEVFEHEQYLFDKAKSRCLFEGFEWKSEMRNSGGNYTWFATNGKIEIVSQWGRLFLDGKIELTTLEMIATESCGLTLTPTAKELIYGTSR